MEKMTLHEMFARQVARTPGAVAVVDDAGETLTYAQLDDRVNRIAGRLRAEGVGPDTPVGILLDRSAWLPAAVLGILRAGGAFVPLDFGYPTTRLQQILQGAGVLTTLVDAGHDGAVEDAGGMVVRLGSAFDETYRPAPGSEATVHPWNLAAIYHTSGSTGTPKGVMCTHEGWVNRMEWMQQRHHLAEGDTVLQKSVITFDDSALEFLWPLLVGGRVALMAGGDAHLDPRAVIDAAILHRTAHLQFVPGLLDLFLDSLTDRDVAALRHLRSVGSSGEALYLPLVDRFHERFGGRVTLDNTWGVTEVSIDSTWHMCPPDAVGHTGRAPIGIEMTGNTVYLLDDLLRPVPEGETGELCVGGVGLARGYVGDPGRTAAVFVPDPTLAGGRMYRTGDCGHRRPDGALMFLGRKDDQVKVRGVRVELGEVEAALRGLPGVADAAAMVWQPEQGEHRLAAYVVAAGACTLVGNDLRERLRAVLPTYAVPDFVGILQELPRHSNGKVRRKALPLPSLGSADTAEQPATDTEKIVEELWKSVLGAPSIGVRASFFDVGGNSLLATRLLGRLRRAFELQLPMKFIFDHPTIRLAAARIDELILNEAEDAAVNVMTSPA